MTKSKGIHGPHKQWTDAEKQEVVRRYPHERTVEIACALGASTEQIYRLAARLKLAKTAEYLESDAACRLRRGDDIGKAFRFKPGHEPANKGLRRPGYAAGNMAKTQFRHGDDPHNTLPIGSYRCNKDGVLQQKISNSKGNSSVRWRGVHELVWVAANGPLPPKHIVVFKQGRRTVIPEEITSDAVECISLSENMKRNTRHNYSPEINEVIHMRAVLTRHINKREKNEQK